VSHADGVTGEFGEQVVTVRFWAAARAAAGRDRDVVAPGTLADVLAAVRELHAGDADPARFDRVVASCAVLLGDRPVTTADPTTVDVPAGSVVELLPPFAGG